MPDYVLCCSDMQFNIAGRNNMTNFEEIRIKYKTSGYVMPKLVFWNLNAGYGFDTPATSSHENVALVSGFSPAILKTVLAGEDCSPIAIMNDTVMIERYRVLDAT